MAGAALVQPLRLAVAQPCMQWSGDANLATMLECIAQAAAAGAALCVFPELAITGFHRQIASQAKPDLVRAWTQALQASCAQLQVAASFGAPTFATDGRIFNSQLFVDQLGDVVGVVEKKGLTPAEATFFAYGEAPRPTFAFAGLASTAVICREIEDIEDVAAALAGNPPSIVYWPGLMSPEEGTEHLDPPRHVQNAQTLAARLGTYIVQANWPNALNYPERNAWTGASAVISPTGSLLFRLPQAQAGVAVFLLGEETYEWLAHEGA